MDPFEVIPGDQAHPGLTPHDGSHVTEGSHVAAGGVRRGVLGLVTGLAFGLCARLVMGAGRAPR